MYSKKLTLFSALMFCIAAPLTITAAPVGGTMLIDIGPFGVSSSGLNFPVSTISGVGALTGTGDFVNYFRADLQNASFSAISDAKLITFSDSLHYPDIPIYFDLTGFAPGAGSTAGCNSNAIGSVCTPSGLPLTVTQLSGQVGVSLTLIGYSYTGSPATGETLTTISFGGGAQGYDMTDFISQFDKGSVEVGGNAAYLYAIPEPAPLSLITASLIAFAALRYFTRKSLEWRKSHRWNMTYTYATSRQ